MSRRLLLRLTRPRDLPHRLTARRPLVRRVTQEPAIARFLATGAAPRAALSPRGGRLFRPALPLLSSVPDLPTAPIAAPGLMRDAASETAFTDTAASLAYEPDPPLPASPIPEGAEEVMPPPSVPAESAAPSQVTAPSASDAPVTMPTVTPPVARQAMTAPPPAPMTAAPRIAPNRRELLRAVAANITAPPRESPPAAPTRQAAPIARRPATPQPGPIVEAPGTLAGTAAEAMAAPVERAVAQDAPPVTAMPPPVGEAETAAVLPNTARDGTGLERKAAPAVPQAAAPPAAKSIVEAIQPAANADAQRSIPTPPLALPDVPPLPAATPAAATPPPQPETTSRATAASAPPSVPPATETASALSQTSPVAEVRAARLPRPLAPSAPPASRPAAPAPPPRAQDAPAVAASQVARDTLVDAAISPEATAAPPVQQAAIADAEPPAAATIAPEAVSADNAAERIAALGRRLFANTTQTVPPEAPSPSAPVAAPTPPVPAHAAPSATRGNAPAPVTATPPPEPEAIRAEDLFQANDSDRSPQAWMARLARAAAQSAQAAPPAETMPAPASPASAPVREMARDDVLLPAPAIVPYVPAAPPRVSPRNPQPPVASTPGAETAAPLAARQSAAAPPLPTPLPESVRRFLAPVVGIDPAEVPVHRGPQATVAASAHRADAITDGAEIALAAGNDDVESPRTLGLIAHELTHVARRRDPQFVPPILRPRSAVPPAASPTAPRPDEPEPAADAATMDEEALAERVEARVMRAAQAHPPLTEHPRGADGSGRAGDTTIPPEGDMSATATNGMSARAGRDPWGGLPAPWEPLPAWLTEPNGDTASTPASSMAGMTVLTAPAPAAPPAIQRAEEGRESAAESATEPAAVSAPQGEHPPVEPDLDALSRQVYAILKRRLAVERRSGR